MWRYSIEQRIRKYVKGHRFLSFARKYKTQLLDKGLDVCQNLVHKPGVIISEIKWQTR